MPPASLQSASIIQQHRDEVYRWAYRLLGRHHDALDVAQDVFVRWLHAQGDHESPIRNPRAWLRRATINRAIDVMRARTNAVAIAVQPEIALRSSDDLERAELRQEITLALEMLTDSQRSVLIAKVFDELTFAQIAAEHDLAVPTVKTHYLRAVTAMRDRLQRLHLLEGHKP